MIAPSGTPGRYLGLALCLPLFFFPRQPIPSGTAQVTLLDVGQGLSVVVQTSQHTLVYDTGPRLGTNFDAARAALIPFLQQHDITQIDKLMVSSVNSQHTGGIRSLLEQFPITQIITYKSH